MSGLSHQKQCFYVDIGMTSLPRAQRLMSAARELRLSSAIPDLLLFMAHPPTIAFGLRENSPEHSKDLLVSPERLHREGIALVKSPRGGGVTYHWPGQVVCYPVLLLEPRERDVPAYMHGLEEVGIRTLERFGVPVARRRVSAAHVGLWIGNRKYVSMGIHISRWVTTFGFVINLGGEHKPSAYIRPCGIEGAELGTVEEFLGQAPLRSQITDTVKETFADVFGRTAGRMSQDVIQEINSHMDMSEAQETGSGCAQ